MLVGMIFEVVLIAAAYAAVCCLVWAAIELSRHIFKGRG